MGNVNITIRLTVSDNVTGTTIIPNTNLGPGQSTEYVTGTSTYTITKADLNNGSVTNSETVGTSQLFDGIPVPPSSIATVTVYACQNPALTIAKLASPTKYTTAGDVITYNYTVTNTGNVDILGDITVTDDHISSPVTISNSDLLPGHSVTGTATYKITEADIDTCCVTNSAYATNNNIKSNMDTAKVTCEKPTHEEENNGEPWNGGPGYGGALVPAVLCMAVNLMDMAVNLMGMAVNLMAQQKYQIQRAARLRFL